MTGIRYRDELSLGPRAVQVPGGDGRRADVVAALNDDCRDLGKETDISDESAAIEESLVHEIVVLDASEGKRVMWIRESRDDIRPPKKSNGRRLPGRPGYGGRTMDGWIGIIELPAISVDQVAPIVDRNQRNECLPQVGEDRFGSSFVEPIKFALSQGEDPAKHKLGYAFRVRLHVGERKRAPLGSTENQPTIDAQILPQQLEIIDEMPGGVGSQIDTDVTSVAC